MDNRGRRSGSLAHGFVACSGYTNIVGRISGKTTPAPEFEGQGRVWALCYFLLLDFIDNDDHDDDVQIHKIDAVRMLYELVGIVRPGSLSEVKEIAHTIGSLVLKNGGVVRGISNWGVFSLPRPISIHQMKHTHGHYFVMRYDSSTRVHQEVRSTLRLEPRMIRAGHVKLGDGKLETLSRFGMPKWRTSSSEA